MAQLTHAQYDATRASRGGWHADRRPAAGTPRVRPRSAAASALRDGREAIEARNPTTGHELTIFLDEIDGIEVVR